MNTSRRSFIAGSAAAMVSAAAPQNGRLKAGLIGCGGRGTQAAVDLLTGNPDVELTAMADVFEDHLESSLRQLRDPAFLKGNVVRILSTYCRVNSNGMDIGKHMSHCKDNKEFGIVDNYCCCRIACKLKSSLR